MRAEEESAEAIVVWITVERRKERRAEEPRECNQPKGLDSRGEKDIETQGCGHGGRGLGARREHPVDSGETRPAMSESLDRRKEVEEDAQ